MLLILSRIKTNYIDKFMLHLIIMDNDKTCFFIGNRHAPSDIKEQLAEVIEQHINEFDVTTFIVGRYGNFDSLVTGVLQDIKKRHTNIELYLLAPYALVQKIEIPVGFDGTFFPEGLETVPMRYAIVKANRYMIQHSDYLISYCHHIGNTRKIVEYAQRCERKGLIKVTLL